jgi:hypothetical protein
MRLASVLSSLLLIALTVNAQSGSNTGGVTMSAGEDVLHANLKLTTTILSEGYCADGRIRYSLSFKFTNIAGKKVILGRFSPVVSRYMVSRTSKDASAKKYETDARILIGLEETSTNFAAHLDEAQFILLDVGDSYEVKQQFSLSDKDDNGKPLRPGTHLLQVVVPTWYYPRVSNVEWREKWRNKGYLWSDSLISDLMPFLVPKSPKLSDCK